MAREWKTGFSSDRDGKVIEYFVTDAETKEEIDDRPVGAKFPISDKFDQETQAARADQFAEYLNKLDEAARVAHAQIHLVDILSRT